MTEERIRKPYYDDKSLAELQKEIQTVPADGKGKAVAVHYNEMFVRSTVLKLINDILTLQQQQEQLIKLLEYYADEHTYENHGTGADIWDDKGEMARIALQQIQGNLIDCKWCNGTGTIRNHPSDTGYDCPDCEGNGQIQGK